MLIIIIIFDEDFYPITEFNGKGEITSKNVKREDFVIGLAGCFYQNSINDYLVRPMEGTKVVYQIVKGNFIPRFEIDFKEKHIPKKYIFSFGTKDPIENITKYIRSNYYKIIFKIFETNNHIYFSCAGPDATTEHFIYSRLTKKTINWGRNPEEPLWMLNSDSEVLYTVIENSAEVIQGDQNIELLEKYLIEKMPKNLNPEKNPILVKIKFKF